MIMQGMLVVAAMLLGGQVGANQLEAENRALRSTVKRLQDENAALKDTVKRVQDGNTSLNAEVKRLHGAVEKLQTQVAELTEKLKRRQTAPAAREDDPAATTAPADEGEDSPPDFASFKALAEALPNKAYPRPGESRNRQSVRALQWYNKTVKGKTVVLALKVSSVDVTRGGRRIPAQIHGTGPTEEIRVGGRECSWRLLSVNAKMPEDDRDALKSIKPGDTVRVRGKVGWGTVKISRVTGGGKRDSFVSQVAMSLFECKLIKVTHATDKKASRPARGRG